MIVREILDSHKQGYYKKGKFESGSTHFVRISDIRDNAYLNESSTPMINVESDVIEKFSIKKNDFLFARTGGAGRFCLIKKDVHGIFASYLIRFRFNKNYDSSFLRYYFLSNSFQSELKSKIHGGVNQNVHAENIKDCPVPEILIEEQKRIVTKLDECFEAIDKARVNVEKNLNNAKELFQSQLNQIFSQKGDGWVEKKLGEVCIVERGSSPRPIKDYLTESEDGVNWIKIGDTKNVEKYIYATKQKITKEGANRSRFVDVGDFILTNSMTYGKPYIMKTKGYIHDGWFVLRLPDEINSEFFWYLLASPYTMEQFEYLAAGAIVKNISGDLVKKAILPIPPIGEQATIVEKMDTLSSQTQFLESNFQQELDALDELKKSILQKAFNGEL